MVVVIFRIGIRGFDWIFDIYIILVKIGSRVRRLFVWYFVIEFDLLWDI